MHDDDEPTQRTKRVTEVEMRSYELESRAQKHERDIKRLRFWGQALGGLAVACVLVGMAVPGYVRKESHDEEHAAALNDLKQRMTVLETKVDMMQLGVASIVKAVHAPALTAPAQAEPPTIKEAK